MPKVLAVRNAAQKVLWEEELLGQISDGMWENVGPRDHYRDWMDVTVIVAPTGHVGRNFHADKDNYNFANTEFISIVGDRMLTAVQAHLGASNHYTMRDLRTDLKDLKTVIRTFERYADVPVMQLSVRIAR